LIHRRLTKSTSALFRAGHDTRIRPVGRHDRRGKQSSQVGFPSPFGAPAFASWTLLFPPENSPSLRSAYPPRSASGLRWGFRVPRG
jgi:hypothetical protein